MHALTRSTGRKKESFPCLWEQCNNISLFLFTNIIFCVFLLFLPFCQLTSQSRSPSATDDAGALIGYDFVAGTNWTRWHSRHAGLCGSTGFYLERKKERKQLSWPAVSLPVCLPSWWIGGDFPLNSAHCDGGVQLQRFLSFLCYWSLAGCSFIILYFNDQIKAKLEVQSSWNKVVTGWLTFTAWIWRLLFWLDSFLPPIYVLIKKLLDLKDTYLK